MRALAIVLVAMLSAAGCGDNDTVGQAEGIFARMGEAMPRATPAQLETFNRGRNVGTRRFSPEEGFGPEFNTSFCLGCHERPVFGGSAPRYRNFLLVGQELEDGSFVATGKGGVQTQYSFLEGRTPSDPRTNITATRNPIPFFGVGLLAEVSDEEILSRADPDDEDGDGISGRANFDRGFVGRFGRKAQNVAIESFIRGPLFNHLGLTSNPLSATRRLDLPVASSEPSAATFQVGAPDEPLFDNDAAPDPELSENDLFDLVSFSMLLAPPPPDEPTPESEHGRSLFEEANCIGCHVDSIKTARGTIPAFTDLLIHDMGEELNDGIIMGLASGQEFRTAPLWGVVATGPYLHDGRATTLDEAIRLHGGEAAASRDFYVNLPDADRDDVLAFLASLGGADQTTAGLLPPDAPIPGPGEFGAPPPNLDEAGLTRFARGRAIFDRNVAIDTGLGPFFNGDSCRACHFDPVIGGAGPSDVDVTRHAIIDYDLLTFAEPSIGTMAHRHNIDVSARAPFDPAANFVERRQTPPIFGLGLVDQIPRETIEALADPDDVDQDGISGRAHILSDGRLGRLGWKANVPNLGEFARDAMFNEVGVTLPDQPGMTFGAGTDADDAPDPEISAADLDDMVFFMGSLTPPPRNRVNEELEDAGAVIFDSIGCAKCHVAELRTANDMPVPL